MKKLATATIFAVISTHAFADLDVTVTNFTHERGISTATLTIKNGTKKDIASISGECAFLDKAKKPIDIGPFYERNIRIGQTVYAQSRIVSNTVPDVADCRIESVR